MGEDKGHTFTYYKITSLDLNRVVFPDLDEFKRFLRLNHINEIYVREYNVRKYDSTNENGLNEFCAVKDSVAYCISGDGYKNLEDIEESKLFGSFSMSSRYKLGQGRVMKRGEYLDYGYEIISDGFLFYYLKKLGAESYSEFERYVNAFEQKISFEKFKEAERNGIKDYKTYSLFKESGFSSFEEFKVAHEIGIDKKQEYVEYNVVRDQLSKLGLKGVDQLAVYNFILKEKGIKIELGRNNIASEVLYAVENSKFLNMLNAGYLIKNESAFRGLGGSNSLNWKRIDNDLKTLPSFTSIGTYNSDKKIFFKFTDIIVYIDGSNVAWNNGSKKNGDRPNARNIIYVIEEIKKRNPKEIVTFCDANLKYEVEDKNILSEAKKKYDIREVPAGTKADTYIIGFAEKKKNAYVITNDTFGDYLKVHPKNIPYWNEHRIAFMVDKDGRVVLSLPKPLEDESIEYDEQDDD